MPRQTALTTRSLALTELLYTPRYLTTAQIETVHEVVEGYALSDAQVDEVMRAVDEHPYYPRYVYHVAHVACAKREA